MAVWIELRSSYVVVSDPEYKMEKYALRKLPSPANLTSAADPDKCAGRKKLTGRRPPGGGWCG
jgi:hypothetical protein